MTSQTQQVEDMPLRDAFVGPPAPPRMPENLPTIEAMEQFVAAVREWAEN